jgi:hypothetical protein
MGEKAGHPFRGNQFTSSKGGGRGSKLPDGNKGTTFLDRRKMAGDNHRKVWGGTPPFKSATQGAGWSKKTQDQIVNNQREAFGGKIQYPDTGRANPITNVQRNLMAKADADRKEIDAAASRAAERLDRLTGQNHAAATMVQANMGIQRSALGERAKAPKAPRIAKPLANVQPGDVMVQAGFGGKLGRVKSNQPARASGYRVIQFEGGHTYSAHKSQGIAVAGKAAGRNTLARAARAAELKQKRAARRRG